MKHEDAKGSIRIIDNVVSGLYSSTTSNQTTNSQTSTNDKVLRVAIGSDHGGYEAKERLKIFLQESGYRVTDVGTYDTNLDSVFFLVVIKEGALRKGKIIKLKIII